MDEMATTKMFLFVYALFYILLSLFGIADNTPIFPSTSWGMNTANYIINFLVYSTTNWIINVILWAFRIFMFLEIALYIKRIVNPLAN